MTSRRDWLVVAVVLLTQLSVVLLFVDVLAVANRANTVNSQANISSFPVKGDKGDPATPDYNAINAYIDQKIAAAPKSAAALVDYNKIQGYVQSAVSALPAAQQGAKGDKGDKGDTGLTVQNIELQQDGLGQVSWRCVGDTLWNSLKFTSLLKDSCS